jgi:hypothetical protein
MEMHLRLRSGEVCDLRKLAEREVDAMSAKDFVSFQDAARDSDVPMDFAQDD